MNPDEASFPKPTCFVRDDDVGELTDELRSFLERFVEAAIPVSYQIIPARLTEPCAAYLLAAQRAYPDLIEFGQHGLHHRMTLKGRELKREFGPERSLEEQTRVIAEGLQQLRNLLGETAIDVFTPPQHKFDGNTVRAAASAGHRIFSAACYPSVHHQFAYMVGRTLRKGNVFHHGLSYNGQLRPEAAILELSIAVDIDDGKRRKYDAVETEADILRLIPRRPNVGLMFHHAVYATRAAREELWRIVDRLHVMQSRFIAMSRLKN